MKWSKGRRGRLAAGAAAIAVGATLAVGAAAIYKGTKKLRHLQAQVASESAALAALRTEAAVLRTQVDEAAWEETPDGLEPAPASRGATKEELAFLRNFRRPLLEPSQVPSGNVYQGVLAQSLRDGFERDARLVGHPGLTERQRLITYVLLRVNGSIPTYEIRPRLPSDFRELVLGTSGNCGDFAVRLMVALESIGMQAAMISANTPEFPGHVFVDAHDPVEGRSYLLDANYNVMLSSPAVRVGSFISHWLAAGDRKSFADAVEVRTFPVYFRFVDPGAQGFQPNALTPDAINEQRAEREQRWRRWLRADAEALRAWWKKTPRHRPQTLQELAGRGAFRMPAGFDASGGYAKELRVRAGLPSAPPA